MYENPVRMPQGQDCGVRMDRVQSQNVQHSDQIATHSLSNSPDTERMRCAGMMDITAMVAIAALRLRPEASYAIMPQKKVATAPNHAGT
jgi:hypothetical protein